jgi:hypothetical protein
MLLSGVTLDDNGLFGFYTSVSLLNLEGVTVPSVRDVPTRVLCPIDQERCFARPTDPIDEPAPVYRAGEPVSWGDGFHVCGAPRIEVRNFSCGQMPRHGIFLTNVGVLDIGESDISGSSLTWRVFGDRPETRLESDDPTMTLVNVEDPPIPERALWGAPPATY